ncbi:hypothetical protein Taro_055924 [Colocasia esculenta]|uniref:EamA domain-containing protein n=1 Tax=Colocasia esculenta TaxID=4460 RepID=A0A843XVQ7_COLES|nr:hypothetical protein [Colocasia esculenta]
MQRGLASSPGKNAENKSRNRPQNPATKGYGASREGTMGLVDTSGPQERGMCRKWRENELTPSAGKNELTESLQGARRPRMSSRRVMLEEFVILLGLTVTQFVAGAFSVFTSRVLTLGINRLFLVIAGSLTNFVLLAPFAIALERKKWPTKVSVWLILQLFLIALGGGTVVMVLMLMGMEKTSPAIASAMPNLSPGFIFIIAACLRFEKVDIRCAYSRAKIVGTLMCLTGAIAMSFLQNTLAATPVFPSSHTGGSQPTAAIGDWTVGCIYLLCAVFIVSCTVVLQAVTMNQFPAPLSLCCITSLIAAFLTAAFQIVTEKKLDVGSPAVGARTVACIVLLGSTVSSICIPFQTWCIKKRGPVLVSMFSPVGTVCSAVLSALTLGQLLSMGSLAGMCFMFAGLYLVLWAKKKEAFLPSGDDGSDEVDVEKPLLS